MATWVLLLVIAIGALFGLKMVYAFSIALTLPLTQGALFVSTPRCKLETVFDCLPMMPGQVLVDLGCGDGRVLRRASTRYGVRAVGYEVNPLAWCLARLMCRYRDGISVRFQNFWAADVSEADFIFCYLYPDVMPRLARKLLAEARAGATVVSFNFPMADWQTWRVLRARQTRYNDPIYVYEINASANRAGLTDIDPEGIMPSNIDPRSKRQRACSKQPALKQLNSRGFPSY